MGPLAAGPGGRWHTSAPRLRTARHASTVVRKVAPIKWRAIVPASKRQAGHGRSRTHVQFLSSGFGCSMGCLLTLASTVALSLVDDHAGALRRTGGGTRGLRRVHGSGGWRDPHPSYCSDTDELLEAVVAAGFGRVDGTVRVHPGAVDAAGDELARRLTLLPPAADFGPVALPDLNAGAAGDVERAVGVEDNPVGVADMLLQ